MATEYANRFVGSSIWSHWANDKNYGGDNGVTSKVARFINNSDADIWNVDSLLGGEAIPQFEGWQGAEDWNTFYKGIWTEDLPTKFLQHYQLTDWDFGHSATLSDGQDSVEVKMVDGTRKILMGGVEIADGGAYLLPWGDPTKGNNTTSPSDADKMYYFNGDSSAATTFRLTGQFRQNGDYTLYKLTDQGRVRVAGVTAVDGSVTLSGEKGVPYVLVPKGGEKAPQPAARYGEHTGLVDPGFNSGTLKPWHPAGGATIVRTDNGDNVARLGTDASCISQKLRHLTGGKQYTLSANVEIGPGERRATTLGVRGAGVSAQNAFDTTPQKNMVAADAKKGTYSQRAQVTFIAPKHGTVTASIRAVAGAAHVTIDDVRVMASTLDWTPTTGKTHVSGGTRIAEEDFEGNQPGWGPFVKGDAGGATDPRTSYSDLHAPYTQKEWKNAHAPYDSGSLKGKAVDDVLDGQHSLKSHEENTGLVYRTVPSSVPFVAGHEYRVAFDYQSNLAGQWEWVTGVDTVGGGKSVASDVTDTPIDPALKTTRFSQDIVAGCGDTWVGLRKTGGAYGADFVMDDFTVTDLGEVAGGAACATVSAPATASVSPGSASTLVTSFTNNEVSDATDVALELGGVPDGWTVQTATKNGNLFDTVKPGETVKTTWLVTAADGDVGTTPTLKAEATYAEACATKKVSADVAVTVTAMPVIPPGEMTATADSENGTSGAAEGPVSNVLDGDTGTIWHTEYSPKTVGYPHHVTLKLDGPTEVGGFGYQDRVAGGDNGKVKGYIVSVSDDGSDWTQVAQGTLVDSPDMQVITFDKVTTRYVKFTATSALNGLPYASAAEMRLYGIPKDAPSGFAPGTRPGDPGCHAGPRLTAPTAVQIGTKLTVGLSGFAPHTAVTVALDTDALVLGTVHTDRHGAAHVTARIPEDFATGSHTVSALVKGADAPAALRSIAVTASDVPGASAGDGGHPGHGHPGHGGHGNPGHGGHGNPGHGHPSQDVGWWGAVWHWIGGVFA